MEEIGRPYEVIIIDDGSQDNSFKRLHDIHMQDPRWHIIRFRRNFGQTAGMQAGFDSARGEIVITIDADLQNDPHDIPRLIERLDEGYDIVSGWRQDRKEPYLSRRLPSQLANALISQTTGVTLHDYGCSLKVYRAEVLEHITLYGELHRFIPAVVSSVGVVVTEEPVHDRRRQFGESKYGIGRTFRVVLDLFFVLFLLHYFRRPMHLFGGLGLISSLLGFLTGAYLTFVKFGLGQDIGSRPLLMLTVLLIVVGIQMISLGIIAEMLLRIYHESQGRSAYVVRERLESTSHSISS